MASADAMKDLEEIRAKNQASVDQRRDERINNLKAGASEARVVNSADRCGLNAPDKPTQASEKIAPESVSTNPEQATTSQEKTTTPEDQRAA